MSRIILDVGPITRIRAVERAVAQLLSSTIVGTGGVVVTGNPKDGFNLSVPFANPFEVIAYNDTKAVTAAGIKPLIDAVSGAMVTTSGIATGGGAIGGGVAINVPKANQFDFVAYDDSKALTSLIVKGETDQKLNRAAKATGAEAIAGTDVEKWVGPHALKQAINAKIVEIAASENPDLDAIEAQIADRMAPDFSNATFDGSADIASAIEVRLDDSGVSDVKPKLIQIMRQVPSFLSWVGGAVSSDPDVNSNAIDAFLDAMALRSRAEFKFPSGAIPVVRGFTLTGDNMRMGGSGSSQAIFNLPGSTVDIMTVAGRFCRIENFGFYAPGATAGAAIKVVADSLSMEHITSIDSWIGLEGTDCGVFQGRDIRILNAVSSGLYLHDDVQGFTLSDSEINAGNLTRGANGNVRTKGFVSALRMSNVEILAGLRSIVAEPLYVGGVPVIAENSTLGYSKFTSVFFDGAAKASILDGTLACETIGSHWSGAREDSGEPGLVLKNNKGLTLTGGHSNNNGTHGVVHEASNVGTMFNGFDTHNNGYTFAGGSAGKKFEAGSHHFQIIGGSSGNGEYSVNNQDYGVDIEADCYAFKVMGHDVSGNVTAPIRDLSTTSDKTLIANTGGEASDFFPVGGGAGLKKVIHASKAWDPVSMANGDSVVDYITGVTGAVPGNACIPALTSINEAGWYISASCHTAGEVAVSLMNKTGTTKDLAGGTLSVVVLKT